MEKIVVLSASANKLANLKQQAALYATLIMEKLDPDHLGYIEVNEYYSSTLLNLCFDTCQYVILLSSFQFVIDVATRNSTKRNGEF